MNYIGKEITGKQFNEIFKNNTFYKLQIMKKNIININILMA